MTTSALKNPYHIDLPEWEIWEKMNVFERNASKHIDEAESHTRQAEDYRRKAAAFRDTLQLLDNARKGQGS